jgi:hypothetical protein
MEFELTTSHLLGRCSTRKPYPSPFSAAVFHFYSFIIVTVSHSCPDPDCALLPVATCIAGPRQALPHEAY